MKKVLPIVALLGMISFGVQEMNVKADTYQKSDSKIHFWDSKRKVTTQLPHGGFFNLLV
ncbi:hypothetical protein [Bacillus mycoides]|uniref:hypothetical protein n=1 Tax=Bacillus mycoides TaxID=1405 RepID=UPI003D2303E6